MGINFDSIISKTILSAAKSQNVNTNSYSSNDMISVFGEVDSKKANELEGMFKEFDGIDGTAKDGKISLDESIKMADSDKTKNNDNAKQLLSFMTKEAESKVDFSKLSRKNDKGGHEKLNDDSQKLKEWDALNQKAIESGYWTKEQSDKVRDMVKSGKRDANSSMAVLAHNINGKDASGEKNKTESASKNTFGSKTASAKAKTADKSAKTPEPKKSEDTCSAKTLDTNYGSSLSSTESTVAKKPDDSSTKTTTVSSSPKALPSKTEAKRTEEPSTKTTTVSSSPKALPSRTEAKKAEEAQQKTLDSNYGVC